jgi:uncharacterized integral membrane protein
MPKLPANLAPPAAPGASPAAPQRFGSGTTAAERSGREQFPDDSAYAEPGAADLIRPEPGAADLVRPEPDAGDPAYRESAAVDAEPSALEPSVAERPGEPVAGEDAAAAKRARRASLGLTRTSAAWLGVWAGVLAVIVLIIFVAQNTYSVEISFLWLHGRISLALALLIAGVAGAAVAMAIAAGRILQLRRVIRRSR